MEFPVDAVGWMSLLVGIGLALLVRRRKFQRTNGFGIEQFDSFFQKLCARTADFSLIGLSILTMSAGTIILATNHLESWGWLVMTPVCAFALFLLF